MIALTRILGLRNQLASREANQSEVQLANLVETWEIQFIQTLNEWLERVGQETSNLHDRQERWRNRVPWFDSYYLWRPPPQIRAPDPLRWRKAELVFPTISSTEDSLWVRTHPCLRSAKMRALVTQPSPIAVARSYHVACLGEAIPVRLAAATEAAGLLARAGMYNEALAALSRSGVKETDSLRAQLSDGIPAYRAVMHRNQRAELLLALGQTEQALDLLYDTGQEIADLDAPDADTVFQYVWTILEQLRANEQDTRVIALEMRLARTNRRLRAWKEVKNRIIPESNDLASATPRFVIDQYDQTPFLLYYGSTQTGRKGVAIQMDQSMVLRRFLNANRRLASGMVITNGSGVWVDGVRVNAEDVAVQVPFSKTLTHLRVGLTRKTIEAQLSGLNEQWVIPLIVTGFCILLGFLALSAQVSASRRLRELVERQRSFTTRVTHELKTPLAGIRVMAENLESGRYTDTEEGRQMAGQILTEVDRLSQRVNEVLSVTRETQLPRKAMFDVEEILYELIELWGPRMERNQVGLKADIDVAQEVYGDKASVRDAIGCLLDNALKYRDLENPNPTVWVRLKSEPNFVIVEVEDNGLGVPANMRSKIFLRFQRIEGPNRGKAGGHGLGLTQVAEVAKYHRGDITCTSGPENGARFVLRLRAKR